VPARWRRRLPTTRQHALPGRPSSTFHVKRRCLTEDSSLFHCAFAMIPGACFMRALRRPLTQGFPRSGQLHQQDEGGSLWSRCDEDALALPARFRAPGVLSEMTDIVPDCLPGTDGTKGLQHPRSRTYVPPVLPLQSLRRGRTIGRSTPLLHSSSAAHSCKRMPSWAVRDRRSRISRGDNARLARDTGARWLGTDGTGPRCFT
jgi:hypothetical protein